GDGGRGYQGGRVTGRHSEEGAGGEARSAEARAGASSIEDVVEHVAEIAVESIIPAPEREPEEAASAGGTEQPAELAVRPETEPAEVSAAEGEEPEAEKPEGRSRRKPQRAETARPGRRTSKKGGGGPSAPGTSAQGGRRAGRRRR